MSWRQPSCLFTKFDVERDIVGRLLSRLGHRDFSLGDPNAGGRIESGADVSADIGNPAGGIPGYSIPVGPTSGFRLKRKQAQGQGGETRLDRVADSSLCCAIFNRSVSSPSRSEIEEGLVTN